MRRLSIRLRLTAWYLVALTLAMAAAGGGSYWLMRWSLFTAADTHLTARVEGVREFLESMEREMTPAEIQDEFREFAELTLGETLVDVTDDTGGILHRPTVAHWNELIATAGRDSGTDLRIGDWRLGNSPVRVVSVAFMLRGHRHQVVAALPMASTVEALARFRWILVGLLPLVGMLAAVGGYWISKRALAPVDRITQAAREVTVYQLDRRLDVPRADDELRRLAVTFNDMLARLEAAVSDMSKLTAEAAHELRTPVAVIRTTAEVALCRERPAEEYRRALADVVGHAEHLSTLVGDLLLLAREDAGVEPAANEPSDVTAIVRDAVRDSVSMARAREVALQFRDAGSIEVMGHAPSLRRLVTILLDNAIKYSNPGGVVDVELRAGASGDRRTVMIDVTDQGIGIEPADRARVFDRFFRGANARGTAEGSGLGLSIARTIVSRHGGAISISPNPGAAGCRIHVELPQ